MTIVRDIVGLTASLSVGMVVGNIVKATTPANLSTASKVFVVIGSGVLGGIAGSKAVEWVDEQIDDFEEFVSNVKQNRKLKKNRQQKEA